jgi:hypothetical protein
MQIDKSNYEIWLIDWLDGNLTDLQVKQLKSFLDENPDLREEFDGLSGVTLSCSEKQFANKETLKKSASNLPETQFEYLCAAYLENDLSPVQQNELKEITDQFPEKKKLFDLIQKMTLSPPEISYKHKNQLIKITPAKRVIRLAIIGLSAAAVITFFIFNYILSPRNISDKNIHTAQSQVADSSILKSPEKRVTGNLSPGKKQDFTGPKREKHFVTAEKVAAVLSETTKNEILQNDSLSNIHNFREPSINTIPVFTEIDVTEGIIRNTLITSNTTFIVPPYDDRSSISKFFAKNFREKLLKDKSPKDSPLKGYEIAEASVLGLNKLLGWEMALDMTNDENGELKSVYFSSKILKFNTPVKKSEPLQ